MSQSTAMKTLLVLRHAKSSWSDSGRDDHARPLNTRGEAEAPRVGARLREQRVTLDVVISSDAVRARNTAGMVAEAAGFSGTVVLDPRLYLASADEVIAVLRELEADDADTVMIVGHNPGLEALVARMTGEQHDLPTAALAEIVLPIDRWPDLDASTHGTLVSLWRPDR